VQRGRAVPGKLAPSDAEAAKIGRSLLV
jgi:hypothetical protein